MGSDSSPTRVRRPDGAGAVNAAVPTTKVPASSVACGGAGRTERASVLRPTSTGGSPCPPPNPSRVGVVPATAALLTSCSYGLTPAGDRPRSRYGSPRPPRHNREQLHGNGDGRRVCHGAPATSAPVDHASRTGWGRTVRKPRLRLAGARQTRARVRSAAGVPAAGTARRSDL